MRTFQYTAKDKSGRTSVGLLDANSEAEAANILHQKELIVISLDVAKKKKLKAKKSKKVKLEDLVVFSRQLSAMIEAGISLVQSLDILSEQIEDPNLKGVVLTLRQDVEAGMSFYDALGKHPAVFSELFISMAKAGEASGMLNEVLDRLATYLEKTAALNRKVKSALVYPAVVVTMAIAITAFLLIKVVPVFKGIFSSLGGTLPFATQVLIGISDALARYFLFALGFFILCGFLLKKYFNTERGHYKFDEQKLKIPIIGPLFTKLALARFCRTFATLIKSGVPILNALEIVGRTSGNRVIEEILLSCRNAVREGELISQYLSKSKVFPPMVYRMIGVGEQSGQLEAMLTKIADFYDDQIDAAVGALTSMIEPLVIAFLGIVIGAIVISLFMPIFKITSLIQ